jgi:hypothetical protein
MLLALGAGVLGVALSGSVAQAHGGHHGRPYYRVHGRAFAGGYYYPGRVHHHWGRRVWSVTYRRYHYWDPYLRIYYYYDPVRVGYYPCP